MSPQAPDDPATITVAIVNYNGERTLAPTLRSVLGQTGISVTEVVVFDNASTDGSADLVQREFPGVALVRMSRNSGPNPARNAALRRAAGRLVLVMDNDIVLAPDYALRLCEAYRQHPGAGALCGQIRIHGAGDRVQYNGADIHYAGEIRLRSFDATGTAPVGCVSAGATLLDPKRALAVGGFDEDLFFGWEDGDLTFRLSLCGHPCYAVSEAVARHLKAERGLGRIRLQVRNRWWFVLKNYEGRTLALALPAVALFQLCAGAFLLLKGRFRDFLLGTWDGWRGGPALRVKRRAVQAMRAVADRDLLCGDRFDLPGIPASSIPGRILGALFHAYWLLIRPLLGRRVSKCPSNPGAS